MCAFMWGSSSIPLLCVCEQTINKNYAKLRWTEKLLGNSGRTIANGRNSQQQNERWAKMQQKKQQQQLQKQK